MRITPEMIKEAYEKTGIKPTRSQWVTNKKCGCVLTALYCYKLNLNEIPKDYEMAANSGYGYVEDMLKENLKLTGPYIHGFINGFDCGYKQEKYYTSENENKDYDFGYEDGKSAAELIFDTN